MTMREYDKKVTRRLWRMRWRKYGWAIANPVTVMAVAHLVLAAAFALLGWKEAA